VSEESKPLLAFIFYIAYSGFLRGQFLLFPMQHLEVDRILDPLFCLLTRKRVEAAIDRNVEYKS